MWTLDKSRVSSLSELYKRKRRLKGGNKNMSKTIFVHKLFIPLGGKKKKVTGSSRRVVSTHQSRCFFFSFSFVFLFFYFLVGWHNWSLRGIANSRPSANSNCTRRPFFGFLSFFSVCVLCVLDGLPLGLTPFARQSCLVLLLLLLTICWLMLPLALSLT